MAWRLFCVMTLPKNSSQDKSITLLASKAFTVGFGGHVEIALYDEWVVVAFFYEGNPEPQSPVLVPRVRFQSDDQLMSWATQTAELFQRDWAKVMQFETEQHFFNAANFIAREVGASRASVDDLIDAQVNTRRKVLRARFNLPVRRGKFSKWSKPELLNALWGIVSHKPALTWDDINQEIARLYQGKESASGESLRQLARSFGISLREIRRDVRKRKVKS